MSGKKFAPSDTDVRIGQMIRVMREKMGLSQKDVANKIGITFQQVQKYECAANRISAARLYEISRIFEIPMWRVINATGDAYVHDKFMTDLICAIYKLSTNNRKMIAKIVLALTNSDSHK